MELHEKELEHCRQQQHMSTNVYTGNSASTGILDVPLSYKQVQEGAEDRREERAFIFFN